MARNKSLRRMWLIVVGAFLGAVLGDAIGIYIHSDNLPFFDALGAAIGMGLGVTLFLWGSKFQTQEDAALYFELSITIRRPPCDVFAFLRDKDKYPQKPGSPVLVLDQTTPGPAGVGTRYREVVQMLPFVRGEFLSKVTCFVPGERLEEDFEGAGMIGHLAYQFLPEGDGTRLVQRETVSTRGFLKIFEPVMGRTLSRQLSKRLESIKAILESGWVIQV